MKYILSLLLLTACDPNHHGCPKIYPATRCINGLLYKNTSEIKNMFLCDWGHAGNVYVKTEEMCVEIE